MRPTPEPACPRCHDTGWISTAGSLDAQPCSCQKELRKKNRIASARIPKRYLHCTIESFTADEVSLRSARKVVQEFVDCWPGVKDGLLLVGACGTGKTHLAVAALQEIVRQEKPGKLLFRNFQDLVIDLQSSFDSVEGPKKAEILQPILDADLLVFDELGAQKPTQFVQDILYYIINTRYNDERHTIFTTNYFDESGRASKEGSRDETLQLRIGERLRSRLFEMTELVLITSTTDYRRRGGYLR